MKSIIGAIIMGAVSLGCFVFSYLQFHEKGILFHNAYLHASEEERKAMDKKPHYKQSGVIFSLIGVIFLINTVDMLLHTEWLFYLVIAVVFIAIAYAIASSVAIEKNKK